MESENFWIMLFFIGAMTALVLYFQGQESERVKAQIEWKCK